MTVITILNTLVEKVDNMHQQLMNLNQQIETISLKWKC